MRKIPMISHAWLGFVLLLVAGCGGGVSQGKPLSPADHSGKKDRSGQAVSKAAAQGFDEALDGFVAADRSGQWTPEACSSVAKSFVEANDVQRAAAGRDLPEALYNAGLAWQRCGDASRAREYFERAVKVDPAFHRARAQLVLYQFQETGDLDSAISRLDQVIRDAKFQNAEALVSLAALQMQRGSDRPDSDGKDDLARALRNLQRALAIDDSYMPAFNQLAIYYLEQAKAKAGAVTKQRSGGKHRRGMVVSGVSRVGVNEQQLDLAALVASQAQLKDQNYAPIHNTAGLILVELRNFNGAVKAFKRARELDPGFFEAHMNYAAVNLSFRGFEEAERAYRDALKLRPQEYEARLGLALALRGQINDSNFAQALESAQKELDEAKKIAPDRAETYYNEAILTQEFRAKRGDNVVPMLEKAAQQYKQFVSRAGSDPAFAPAVKRAKERMQDIEDTIKFIKEGEEIARQQAEIEKAEKEQKAAETGTPAPAATEPPPAGAPQP